MLAIAGTVTIDPDHREEAIAAAREMMEATRREEGNLDYVFSADLEDPAVFRIYEEWTDQAALDLHFAAPHMARFRERIAGVGVESMVLKKLEIASVGSL